MRSSEYFIAINSNSNTAVSNAIYRSSFFVGINACEAFFVATISCFHRGQ